MTRVIIGVEAMSILMLLVVFYGNTFEVKELTLRRKVFSIQILLVMIAMLADACSWALDGNAAQSDLNFLLTGVAALMTFPISGLFAYFIYLYISEHRKIRGDYFRGLVTYCMVAMMLVGIGCITGNLYSIVDGYYVEGPYYNLYLLANSVTLSYALAVILLSKGYLSRHDMIATICYVLLPAVTMLINGFWEEFSFTYPAVSLAVLICYIMLEKQQIEQLQVQETRMTQQALVDELTGLRNRRAYTETVDDIVNTDQNLGIIFADMNGLKYVNDHFGHERGDKYIRAFANVLLTYLRKDEIFRISGDEFVVIMPGVRAELVLRRLMQIRDELKKFEAPLASLGFAFGSASEIKNLLKDAELMMYEEKKKFYEVYPSMKR